MSRRIQIKEKEKMRKDYIEAMRWQNREQALLPLQNTAQGKPGDKVLYQSLIVRFEDIWIKKFRKKLNEFPENTTRHEGYTKQELINEIKHYEAKKNEALAKLGNIVYKPVITMINEQEEQQEQQQQQQQGQQQEEDGDGDVVMSGETSIGGKKRRRKRTKKRRRNNRKKRTKRRR